MGAHDRLKILVTGAQGQLGSAFRKVAQTASEWDFSFAARSDLDLSQAAEADSFFKRSAFDFAINCAAYTAVDRAETQREAAYAGNVLAVEHLVEACRKYAVIPVHYSTDHVFDGAKRTPYREIDLPNPINYYGYTKRLGETRLEASGIEYYLFRTSWVYSDYGQNFVKTLTQKLKAQAELRIVDDQRGCLTQADWLAAQTLQALKSRLPFGLYHLSGRQVQSRYEIARELAARVNPRCRVVPIPTRSLNLPAARPPYSVLDNAKYDAFF